jgi:ribonuclease HII
MKTVKIEVEIGLDDFFNNEVERSAAFQEALQGAIMYKLNDSKFVQENIAYYLFDKLKTETFKNEMEKIESAIKTSIDNFKIDDWSIRSHKVVEKVIDETMNGMKEKIKNKAQAYANEYVESDSDDYKSIRQKVADAMAENVFNVFIDAMVKREINK